MHLVALRASKTEAVCCPKTGQQRLKKSRLPLRRQLRGGGRLESRQHGNR